MTLTVIADFNASASMQQKIIIIIIVTTTTMTTAIKTCIICKIYPKTQRIHYFTLDQINTWNGNIPQQGKANQKACEGHCGGHGR
jgi:NADH:ubiquinone oxidoreductase subunit K